MEGRGNGRAGIAGGGDDDGQVTVLAGLQPRQRTGQETRTNVLNAAVGPWNSSSKWSPSPSARSGTGKSNASRQIDGNPASSASPAKNGASRSAAVSARVAPASSSRGAGSTWGTYRPPSGAKPAAMAALGANGRGPAAGRNELHGFSIQRGRRIQHSRAPGASSGDTQASLSKPAAANAPAPAPRRVGLVGIFEPGEHAGAGTGDARAHCSG